jgi:uncharacterized repeat protein (TIGR01451 family)
MKIRNFVMGLIATSALTMASADRISMKTTAYEEVVETKAGKEIKVLKVLTKAIPGDVVTYVNKISNPTDKEAKRLTIVNKVPEHTNFVAKSVECNGCTVLYSIDGKEYKKSSELFIKEGGVKRLAKAEEYSHLKFILASLRPKSEIDLKFKTKIQ